MNWDAIGAIGQILGSVAVFVTLGYLAVQVRDARSEARRALSQGRGEAVRAVNTAWLDERISTIFMKGDIALEVPALTVVRRLMDEAKLTREEAFSAAAQMRTLWLYHQQIIPLRRRATPDRT
jgi:hypothetical protein